MLSMLSTLELVMVVWRTLRRGFCAYAAGALGDGECVGGLSWVGNALVGKELDLVDWLEELGFEMMFSIWFLLLLVAVSRKG